MPKDKEPVAETVSPETESEMVTVSKDKLDAILAKQEAQDKEIAILRDAASGSRLAEAEDKRKEAEKPRAYLKVFKGKIVTSWKSTEAKVIHNATTGQPVGEVLQAIFFFNDGTDSGPVDQVDFTRTEEREHVRILERVDHKTVRVQFENPMLSQEPFDIEEVFLNP